MEIILLERCNDILYINKGHDIIMAIVNALLMILSLTVKEISQSDNGFHLMAMNDGELSRHGIVELGTYHEKGSCPVVMGLMETIQCKFWHSINVDNLWSCRMQQFWV